MITHDIAVVEEKSYIGRCSCGTTWTTNELVSECPTAASRPAAVEEPAKPTDYEVLIAAYPDARVWEHAPGDWQVAAGSSGEIKTYGHKTAGDAITTVANRIKAMQTPAASGDVREGGELPKRPILAFGLEATQPEILLEEDFREYADAVERQLLAALQQVAEKNEVIGRERRTMKFWEESYLAEHGHWGNCTWKIRAEAAEAELSRLRGETCNARTEALQEASEIVLRRSAWARSTGEAKRYGEISAMINGLRGELKGRGK